MPQTTTMPDPETGWPPRPANWKGPWPPWSPWADIARQPPGEARDLAFILAAVGTNPDFAHRLATGTITPDQLGVKVNTSAFKAVTSFAGSVAMGDGDGGDPCGTSYPGKHHPRVWPHIGVIDPNVALAQRDASLLAIGLAVTPSLRERVSTDAAGAARELNLVNVSKGTVAAASQVAAQFTR